MCATYTKAKVPGSKGQLLQHGCNYLTQTDWDSMIDNETTGVNTDQTGGKRKLDWTECV